MDGWPAFKSYGAAVVAGRRLVKNVPNTKCPHYNTVIGRSDAADKECENPFSPMTRQRRNKKGRQATRTPWEREMGNR